MNEPPTEKDSARAQGKVTIQQALKAFKDHHLIRGDKTSDRWVLARKYEDGAVDSTMLTEVVSLWGGRIFVGGDIDDCSFAYYSDRRDHLSKLAWMGRCQDIFYYVAQKASIGMTDNNKLTWVWDSDAARYDLYQLATDEDSDRPANEKECFIEAMSYADDGEFMVWETLYHGITDPVDLPSRLGMCLSARVIYAWAALHRLCEILLGPNPADPRGDLCP